MYGFSHVRVSVLTSVCYNVLFCKIGAIPIPVSHTFKRVKYPRQYLVYRKQYRNQNKNKNKNKIHIKKIIMMSDARSILLKKQMKVLSDMCVTQLSITITKHER